MSCRRGLRLANFVTAPHALFLRACLSPRNYETRGPTPPCMAEHGSVQKFTWGGRRPGAGRKPGPDPKSPHRERPKIRAATPVHVTLRSARSRLRTPEILAALCKAVRGANRRDLERFRVVHFALRDDRVELIVEAKNDRHLSAGMRSVAIRIARSVNQSLGRKGALWTDRWRGRVLATPDEVRATLVSMLPPLAEPPPSESPGSSGAPVAAPRSALLRSAWPTSGRLALCDRAVTAPSERSPPRRYIVPRGASLAAKTSPVLADQIDVSH